MLEPPHAPSAAQRAGEMTCWVTQLAVLLRASFSTLLCFEDAFSSLVLLSCTTGREEAPKKRAEESRSRHLHRISSRLYAYHQPLHIRPIPPRRCTSRQAPYVVKSRGRPSPLHYTRMLETVNGGTMATGRSPAGRYRPICVYAQHHRLENSHVHTPESCLAIPHRLPMFELSPMAPALYLFSDTVSWRTWPGAVEVKNQPNN